jgi:hypothetical protein
MTTSQLTSNPMVNCLQQDLYPGKRGAPPADSTDKTGNNNTEPNDSKSSGYWSFQKDPSDPAQLTMLVTLITEQSEQGNPTYYSSRLNMSEMQSLYQWLAMQMNQPKADSGKKQSSKTDD